MAETLRDPSMEPSHPGELLAHIVLPATGRTKAEIAAMLHVTRATLHNVLSGRTAISTTIAARLGKLFGNGAGFWIRMQAAYDTWHAERDVDVSAIETLDAG